MLKMFKNSKKGFTLLELLVVVLIIGILAGIALPQYNKSVEKARLSEALLTANALQKAVDMCTLTNGYNLGLFTGSTGNNDILDIDVMKNMDCDRHTQMCYTKHFSYTSACSVLNNHTGSCYVYVRRNTSDPAPKYTLYFQWGTNSLLTKGCEYTDDKFKHICQYLESQGFANGGRIDEECC